MRFDCVLSQTGQIDENLFVTKTTDAGIHPTRVFRLLCNARQWVTLAWYTLGTAWILPFKAMHFEELAKP